MIKKALKAALLDLKSQLRGRKASAYLDKDEEEHTDEIPKTAAKAPKVDKPAEDKPERSAAPKASEAVTDGMDELKAQMKQFMGKKRVGKGSGRPPEVIRPVQSKQNHPELKGRVTPSKAKDK